LFEGDRMFNFLPKEEKFFDFFNESAKNIHRGGLAIIKVMEPGADIEKAAKAVKEIEHQGDSITHEIIKKLNKTFITPIDREDIYALAGALDDVLDLTDAAANKMVIFKIKEATPEARALAAIISQCTEEIVKTISFLGKGEIDSSHFIEINRLENEADRVLHDALAKLFDEEKDPIQVIKWKEIYENLEEATDRCEDVSNILETITLKNT
jgi:predicted phosphate transport protein (TIGR00153 family)